MGHRARLSLIALSLLAFGCGGDDQSTSPAPVTPVAPPAPSPPPPEAPDEPTNVRVTDQGTDFIVWEWDPVEGATSYQAHAFPDGTPSSERPPLQTLLEPILRAEGLEASTAWGMFVRAVRETAAGRVVSPWAGQFSASTWGTPRECSTEREEAIAFDVSLPDEWDGTPFLFYFDKTYLPEEEWADAEHVIDTVERLSERIEDQIGYSVLEVGGWTELPTHDCNSIRDWRSPGHIVAYVIEEHRLDDEGNPLVGAVTVGRRCAVVRYWGNQINIVKDSIIPHEVFHLLGFAHSRERRPNGEFIYPWQSPEGEGVAMSVPLTGGTDPPDLGVTFEDVDALRCIFPQ